MKTPQTWPEGVRPTPEQFLPWFGSCTAAERLEVMTRLLDSSERASECFIQNHQALLGEVAHLQGSYQRGWSDAIDAVRAGIAAGYVEENP